jgi:ribosomal protein S18 acetylase RimI-like enzyme
MVEIQCVRPEHADALARFFAELRTRGGERFFHPHPLTSDAAVELANYRGNDLYVVLRDGDEVVGYAMLRGWDEGYDVPSLGIAIHPGRQGRGFAQLLMSFLHDAAMRRGATRIRLRVHHDNDRAIGLYRALGYAMTDDDDPRYKLGLLNLN